MPQYVHLELKLNGTLIRGDGPDGLIACPSFTLKGARSGTRRVYDPVVFRKPVDSASVFLWDGMVSNKAAEAQFRFYLDEDTGGGPFYWIRLRNALVTSVSCIVPEPDGAAGAAALEEVKLTFQSIVWHFVDGGLEAEDAVTP